MVDHHSHTWINLLASIALLLMLLSTVPLSWLCLQLIWTKAIRRWPRSMRRSPIPSTASSLPRQPHFNGGTT